MDSQPAKYEIEHCYVGASSDYQVILAALVAIVTGLPLFGDEGEPDVWGRVPERMRKTSAGWYSREFPKLFRSLGYDCSPDFKKKFDPDTRYPCLLRFRPTKRQLVRERQQKRKETGDPKAGVQSWWNVLVYYNGLVYDPAAREPWPLERWDKQYFTITTMCQVWVGEL